MLGAEGLSSKAGQRPDTMEPGHRGHLWKPQLVLSHESKSDLKCRPAREGTEDSPIWAERNLQGNSCLEV